MSSIIKSGTGAALYPAGQYMAETVTSFATGDSPEVIDFISEIGKPASNGYLINDGSGDISIAMRRGQAAFGDEIILSANERFDFKGRDIEHLRITWVTNSSYRIFAE